MYVMVAIQDIVNLCFRLGLYVALKPASKFQLMHIYYFEKNIKMPAVAAIWNIGMKRFSNF